MAERVSTDRPPSDTKNEPDRRPREGVIAGLRKGLPVAVTAIPFGIAFGAMAVDAGGSWFDAMLMSVVLFAGAAQMAAVQLTADGAPQWVVIAIVVLINARFLMYSAAMAPHFRAVTRWRRLGLAYILTDQAFAMTGAQMHDRPPSWSPVRFYLGVAMGLWVLWLVGTAIGASAGELVPDSIPVDYTAPLVFSILAILTLRDRADLATALSACGVFWGCAGLPYGLGLFPAALTGMLVGRWFESRVQS